MKFSVQTKFDKRCPKCKKLHLLIIDNRQIDVDNTRRSKHNQVRKTTNCLCYFLEDQTMRLPSETGEEDSGP